jgi:glyoxylase-like metal-dependent hydrolase (beta-lactamase superfamily II)
VWIIDPGDSAQLLVWLKQNTKIVLGILLTHSHIDHIYGINDICLKYPLAKIYASRNSKNGLFSPKTNGSYYLDIPYYVENENIEYINNGDIIKLWEGVSAFVFETPGHDYDCVSYHIKNNLFTGDALIPGVKPHTKSKKADKQIAYNTIKWIKKTFDDMTLIYPGHKDSCLLNEINIDL